MATRQFQLMHEQNNALKRVYDQCKDGPTRSRYLAVRLYGSGYPTKEVMDIAGCSRTSLMGWCRSYRTEGMEGLGDKRAGGNRARLTPAQIQQVKRRLHTYTPSQLLGKEVATAQGRFWTVPDLARGLDRWYGVVYQSLSSYYRLLDLCEFSHQRPARVYKSRSEAQVIEFEAALEKTH